MESLPFLTIGLIIAFIFLMNQFHHKKHLKHMDKMNKSISDAMMDLSLMIEKVKKNEL